MRVEPLDESLASVGSEFRVHSKFIMLEDRAGNDRRLYGGRYTHTIRPKGARFEILMKRVDLTNCGQSFPMLSQPF